MSAPVVFDRSLVRRRLRRALGGYADFLLRRAVEEVGERLAGVLREFPLALDLGTPTAAATERLTAGGRCGRVVRMAPVPTDRMAPAPAVQVTPVAGSSPARTEGGPGPLLVGDEEALPFRAESFDLAVSLLALQGVNDLPGALVQVRRALKPDGLFLGCLLGGATLTELRQAFAAAEAEVEGGISPRVAPFADVRDLGHLLQRAGFALPVADVESVVVRYADLFGLVRDLRAMGLSNALAERRRTPLRRATLMRAAQVYAERFADPDGRVRATFEIVWLSGWAPHESQQRPLRPGSAKARLADALGVEEHAFSEKARP